MTTEKMTVRRTVELNFVQGEKVCITPIGETEGVDGRLYRIDPVKMIANIRQHIPLFENHKDWDKAIGWFSKESLEIRPDGIYASLELNQEGQALIDNKSFRYLSPTYWVQDNREVTELVSVGLVNQPNLLFKELNHADKHMSQLPPVQIDKDARLDALEAEYNRLQQQYESLKQEARAMDIDRLIANGELSENQRAIALIMDDNTLKLLVEANKQDNLKSKLSVRADITEANTRTTGAVALNDVQRGMCEQLGISEEQFQAGLQSS